MRKVKEIKEKWNKKTGICMKKKIMMTVIM